MAQARRPIPGNWFTEAAAHLPALPAESAVDAVKWHRELARIGRHALARIDQNGLQMHRLTQAIVRCHLVPAQAASARARAEAIVAANHPGDQNVPSTWPGWARLLPHLLVLAPAESSNQTLRDLACDATRYLIRRGDARNSYDFADRLYLRWRDQFGADDACTLRVAGALASALRELGRYGEARELDEDTLAHKRRLLGDDHTSTMCSADSLAADMRALGDLQAAAIPIRTRPCAAAAWPWNSSAAARPPA
jgi:Tetratricopeptide repeat